MVRIGKTFAATLVIAASVFVMLSGGCGSKAGNGYNASGVDPGSMDTDAESAGGDSGASPTGGGTNASGGGFFSSPTNSAANCPAGAPLSCFVSKCSNGGHTTLTGKVYDPAGKVPIYNVIVFVPNDKSTLPVITPGTSSCNTCDVPVGDYVSVTTTDKTGSFTLQDVPTGTNVPLVVQIGKWRRIITVPSIADCKTTTLPGSGASQARLPRNHHEGDMPQMALLTGGLDDLGCFLTRVGIDAAEYTAPQGGGRLDIYQGLGTGGPAIPGLGAPGGGMNGPGLSNGTAGDCTTTSCPLWSSKKTFENYDIVLLACEGDTFDPDANPDGGAMFGGTRANVTTAGKQYMHDWLNEGGKVFATHFHYTWFANGPADFRPIANWLGSSIGSGKCNCSIDTSFPKGQTFHDWLNAVGGLTTGGTVSLTGVAKSVAAVNAPTSRWIYDNSDSETKYMSFETPIGGKVVPADPDAGTPETKAYCGKAVFSDLHAGGSPSGDVPGSCKTTDLTAQEKALEFLFFDLASCVQDDAKPIVMPPK